MDGVVGVGRERGRAMEARVLETAGELGIMGCDADLLAVAHRAAMALRDEVCADDHDPRYLHPGRTALILMQDVGQCDADVLAAALLTESADASLRVEGGMIASWPDRGPRVLALRDAVPASGDPELIERLVVEPDAVRHIALAERLDHLRHAHLWSDLSERRRAHAEAEAVYLPLAERTHPTLARRFAWWCRMFSRRHLR